MKKLVICILSSVCILSAQEAPIGSAVQPDGKEKKSLEAFANKVKGKIVWASSRSNSKHDIWIMNADGTDQKQLTKSDHVDWFSRFSPDGKKVLFVRSKAGWERESEADVFDKWDLFTIGVDGTGEQKVADNACWGTWRPGGDSIVFARGPKVFIKDLNSGNEVEIFDAAVSIKKGTYSQEPNLSPDGKMIAITLRGSSRETGVWNTETKVWYKTGAGCQSDWFPDGKKILRMNEGQGNGGTEVLAFNIDTNGKPVDSFMGLTIPKHMRFMDIPGRRSHEYFPKIDRTGKWLVWCATQIGHEHDMVDYEVYIWDITTDKTKDFVRLTFHSGNDRWPDIFIE
ncbi:MAG TPA: hypothetical protein VHO70_01835 [Chitinispirillaceae bacterium]|nr:hypothetical protein [Chitinispirillaceae bacterium]